MSSYTPEQQHAMIKGTFAFGLATLADQQLFARQNIKESLLFGASVSAGLIAGDIFGGQFAQTTPEFLGGNLVSSKSIIQRTAELGGAVAVAYSVNRFLLKNDYNNDEMMTKLAIIGGVSLASEYFSDWYSGTALSYM